MSTLQAELYDALIAAGAPEEKARAAALSPGELATKKDLQELSWRLIGVDLALATLVVVALSVILK